MQGAHDESGGSECSGVGWGGGVSTKGANEGEAGTWYSRSSKQATCNQLAAHDVVQDYCHQHKATEHADGANPEVSHR